MDTELKQRQKAEAIKRLNILKDKFGLLKNVVDDFEKENLLYYSEQTRLGGMLYWCTKDNGVENLENIVKDSELTQNSIVYHAIHTYTEFGELFSMLYVSPDEEEWEHDIEDLIDSYPLIYCKNLDDDFCSEFGCIGIKGMSGGLIRVS